jgi:hypothetical protein
MAHVWAIQVRPPSNLFIISWHLVSLRQHQDEVLLGPDVELEALELLALASPATSQLSLLFSV